MRVRMDCGEKMIFIRRNVYRLCYGFPWTVGMSITTKKRVFQSPRAPSLSPCHWIPSFIDENEERFVFTEFAKKTLISPANYISHIYDITIGYPYDIVQSEINLVVQGNAPREVSYLSPNPSFWNLLIDISRFISTLRRFQSKQYRKRRKH